MEAQARFFARLQREIAALIRYGSRQGERCAARSTKAQGIPHVRASFVTEAPSIAPPHAQPVRDRIGPLDPVGGVSYLARARRSLTIATKGVGRGSNTGTHHRARRGAC